MARKQTPAPPPEALPEGEPNPLVAKHKQSLCKSWSVTKSGILAEIFDLATFLWALDRADEAVAIASSVVTAVPEPPPLPGGGVNYTLWCPATYAHAMVVRLGSPAVAAASRTAILTDCGINRGNPGFLEDRIADARVVANEPASPKSTKFDRVMVSRAVGKMLLCAELAAAGDPFFAPHGAETAALVPVLLAKLGAMLRCR